MQFFYRKNHEKSPSATKTKVSDDGQDTWLFDDCVFLVVGSGGVVRSSRLEKKIVVFITLFGSFCWATYLRCIGLTLSFSSALDCKMSEFCAGEPSIPWQVRDGYGFLMILRVWSFHRLWVNWFQMTLYIGTSVFHQVLSLNYGVFPDLQTIRSCLC